MSTQLESSEIRSSQPDGASQERLSSLDNISSDLNGSNGNNAQAEAANVDVSADANSAAQVDNLDDSDSTLSQDLKVEGAVNKVSSSEQSPDLSLSDKKLAVPKINEPKSKYSAKRAPQLLVHSAGTKPLVAKKSPQNPPVAQMARASIGSAYDRLTKETESSRIRAAVTAEEAKRRVSLNPKTGLVDSNRSRPSSSSGMTAAERLEALSKPTQSSLNRSIRRDASSGNSKVLSSPSGPEKPSISVSKSRAVSGLASPRSPRSPRGATLNSPNNRRVVSTSRGNARLHPKASLERIPPGEADVHTDGEGTAADSSTQVGLQAEPTLVASSN